MTMNTCFSWIFGVRNVKKGNGECVICFHACDTGCHNCSCHWHAKCIASWKNGKFCPQCDVKLK